LFLAAEEISSEKRGDHQDGDKYAYASLPVRMGAGFVFHDNLSQAVLIRGGRR